METTSFHPSFRPFVCVKYQRLNRSKDFREIRRWNYLHKCG